MEIYADLVLKNGNLVTLDPQDTIASAMAIRQGRIAAVGDETEMEPWIGPDTEVVDLQGKTVLPGINDSHFHLPIAGLRCLGYSEQEYMFPERDWTYEEKEKAVTAALDYLRKLGVTSITEGELGHRGHGMRGNIADADIISILNDKKNKGELTARVNLMISYGNKHEADCIEYLEDMLPKLGFHTGFGDRFLRIAGLKLFADGAPGNGNACTREPYSDGHVCGLKILGDTEEERHRMFVEMIRYGHRMGYTLGIHCTGDRGIDAVTDGYLANLEEDDWDARDYFIHGEMMREDCLERLKGKKIGYSALFSALWLNGGPEAAVGRERGQAVFPVRSVLDAGLVVTGHTDYPFLPADWRESVEAAVTRKTRDGRVTGADQAVTITEALRMFTMNGAWQTHQEDIKGTLEAGKLADLCILKENILEVPWDRIHEVTVEGTYLEGRKIW